MCNTSLENLLKRYFYFPNLAVLYTSVAMQCVTCARSNVAGLPGIKTRVQHSGRQPFEDVKVDFSEIRPS